MIFLETLRSGGSFDGLSLIENEVSVSKCKIRNEKKASWISAVFSRGGGTVLVELGHQLNLFL